MSFYLKYKMWRVLLLISFFILVEKGIGLTGEKECPDAKVIHPCHCYYRSGHAYLTCQNFTDSEVLRKIFINSQSYEFAVVVIQDSTLEYLPHEILDSVRMLEFQLKKTTIEQAFDQTPIAVGTLKALIIDDIKIERSLLWDLMKPLESLRFLYIINNTIETLGRDFSDHVTKNLVALSLYSTYTKKILPGTFATFKKLDQIQVTGGQIEVLTRDVFPKPYLGRYLYFTDQKLREIPDGLFSEMPNLSVISFKNNQIATLPERAFDKDIFGKVSIFLNENPLKCDCKMVWIIETKPRFLQGKCESPKNLHGKELNELTIHNFNC